MKTDKQYYFFLTLLPSVDLGVFNCDGSLGEQMTVTFSCLLIVTSQAFIQVEPRKLPETSKENIIRKKCASTTTTM